MRSTFAVVISLVGICTGARAESCLDPDQLRQSVVMVGRKVVERDETSRITTTYYPTYGTAFAIESRSEGVLFATAAHVASIAQISSESKPLILTQLLGKGDSTQTGEYRAQLIVQRISSEEIEANGKSKKNTDTFPHDVALFFVEGRLRSPVLPLPVRFKELAPIEPLMTGGFMQVKPGIPLLFVTSQLEFYRLKYDMLLFRPKLNVPISRLRPGASGSPIVDCLGRAVSIVVGYIAEANEESPLDHTNFGTPPGELADAYRESMSKAVPSDLYEPLRFRIRLTDR